MLPVLGGARRGDVHQRVMQLLEVALLDGKDQLDLRVARRRADDRPRGREGWRRLERRRHAASREDAKHLVGVAAQVKRSILIGVFFTVLPNKKKKDRRRRRPVGGRRGERKGKERNIKEQEGLDTALPGLDTALPGLDTAQDGTLLSSMGY